MNAAQFRKDLAHLGEFGVRGVGYGVADLRTRLGSILGLDRIRVVVIVGAGHLGQALAEAGVRGILNFAPATVGPFAGTTVKNVDLTLSLETLAIQLTSAVG